MRFRAEAELDCVDPDKFAELYLAGRAKSSFPSYDHAFRKAWIHGRMIGKTIFNWSPMDLAGHFVVLSECQATSSMFKQVSAVVTMFKEMLEIDSIASSKIVQLVKRGCLKKAREREMLKGKRERSVMTLNHIKLMLLKLYKRDASLVKPADRRFLVLTLLMFFGIKRFNDVQNLKVSDITVLKDGHLEFFVKESKTDQLGLGFVFHVTGESFSGVSIPKILSWYIKSVGLKKDDYLFPRFRCQGGRVVAQGGLSISYSSSAAQLRHFCVSNKIPVLTLHSGRRGGVTAAVEAGLGKIEIQSLGNWSTDTVTRYFCPKKAGVTCSSRILRNI